MIHPAVSTPMTTAGRAFLNRDVYKRQVYTNWALDPARQPGDTTVIQDTEAEGYQILYFVAQKDPVWQQTADNSLRTEDQTAWEESAAEGYEAALGFAAKFVQ